MKTASVFTILAVVLCALVFSLSGCAQPGETTAEGRRRHIRNLRIDNQGLAEDVDMFLLTDRPSKLTDKRIP